MSCEPETHYLQISGRKTQVTRGGQGPPLLYLHSAGGETEWTRFHAKLAEHFTLILPAHPGFDGSEGLGAGASIDDFAWHYVDLLEELQLEQVPVVGFSLGGWTGMELAIRRPEKVSKLVLVNSAGIYLEAAPIAELFIDDLDTLRQRLYFDPLGPAVAESMPQSLNDPRILQWMQASAATARVAWHPYLHNPKLPMHLKRIPCPTRILWGRHDRLIPLAVGEFLASRIPHATLEIFEETGHMLPFEQSERFVRSTQEFVLG
ncbi:MAG: alpha/beta hydrolase [Planctomycetaceae bacterium]|nr:alpha/beta hydrolase [Planctomycetaceae bacterium]